jgi:hypothetical protein
LLAAALAVAPLIAHAGAQAEESLAQSVVTVLSRAISDRPVPADWEQLADTQAFIETMGKRLEARVPDEAERRELLRSVHYESVRAGLDPQLVLAVIHHERLQSAVSPADARGYAGHAVLDARDQHARAQPLPPAREPATAA